MTTAERYRFMKLFDGVVDMGEKLDTSTHIKLAENPFAVYLHASDQTAPPLVFLIECPGFTKRSVEAMRRILRHLTRQPETALSLELHIIAVETEEEAGETLLDNYFVVVHGSSVFLCLGGCSYHTEGYLGDTVLDALFVRMSRTLGNTVTRHHMPFVEGNALTAKLGDYYDEAAGNQ